MSHHVAEAAERPTFTDRVAKWVRWLCVPIVLFWIVVAGLTNVLVPQLEAVGEKHNVGLASPDAPSLQAFRTDRRGVPRVRLRQRRDGGARR